MTVPNYQLVRSMIYDIMKDSGKVIEAFKLRKLESPTVVIDLQEDIDKLVEFQRRLRESKVEAQKLPKSERSFHLAQIKVVENQIKEDLNLVDKAIKTVLKNTFDSIKKIDRKLNRVDPRDLNVYKKNVENLQDLRKNLEKLKKPKIDKKYKQYFVREIAKVERLIKKEEGYIEIAKVQEEVDKIRRELPKIKADASDFKKGISSLKEQSKYLDRLKKKHPDLENAIDDMTRRIGKEIALAEHRSAYNEMPYATIMSAHGLYAKEHGKNYKATIGAPLSVPAKRPKPPSHPRPSSPHRHTSR